MSGLPITPMQVDLYTIDDDDSLSLVAADIDLLSCFDGDNDAAYPTWAELTMFGNAEYGGGAAQRFKFLRRSEVR